MGSEKSCAKHQSCSYLSQISASNAFVRNMLQKKSSQNKIFVSELIFKLVYLCESCRGSEICCCSWQKSLKSLWAEFNCCLSLCHCIYSKSIARYDCLFLLLLLLLLRRNFSRVLENWEQKNISQTIRYTNQLFVAIKGNFSGLFFFWTGRSEGEFPRDYLINPATCLQIIKTDIK